MGGCASITPRAQPVPFPEVVTGGGTQLDVQNSDPKVSPALLDPSQPDLVILHFDDSHSLVPRQSEPAGGAARFATVLKKYRAERDCLLFFSGDVFNPSRLSTVTKGKHCPEVFKALRPTCGVYGNHDFDFGVEDLVKLAKQCEMPWVMTNVVDVSGGTPVPVANAQKSHLLVHHNVSIGIIGIVEEEWLATIRALPDDVQYVDKVSCAKAEIEHLKSKGAQVIIALTHMREKNDRIFLEAVPEVDLLLGGHDHYYLHEEVNGTKLVKSSSDFMHTTLVEVWIPRRELGRDTLRVDCTKIPIESSIEEDPQVNSILSSFNKDIEAKLNKDMCRLTRELDAMDQMLRTQESSAGNFVADIMREEMHTDVAIVNSGLFRANRVYPVGILKLKDIMDILPYQDIVVSINVTGKCLKEALECGLSKFPSAEGRFPQVAGLRLLMDPKAPEMDRVKDIHVAGEKLDPNRVYTLATTSYLSTGGDGYLPLKDQEYIVDSENGPILPTMVRQYLTDLIGKAQHMERRMSINSIKEDRRLSKLERDECLTEVKKAFLPNVKPRIEGRIIISEQISSLDETAIPNFSSSSIQSFQSLASLLPQATPADIRRTSVAHPIPIMRTMTNLTDYQFARDEQTPVATHVRVRPPERAFDRQASSVSSRLVHHAHESAAHRRMDQPTSSASSITLAAMRQASVVVGSIYDAAAEGDVEELQAMMKHSKGLLNRKGTPNRLGLNDLKSNGLSTTTKDAGTPLHFAIAFGQLPAVEYLLEQGSDIKTTTQMGGNARELAYGHLMKAQAAGNTARVRVMESILNTLKVYEESLTEEMRYIMDR